MQNQEDDFTLKNYERCIFESIKKGYTFSTIRDFYNKENLSKLIVKRHDVDTQIDVALKMSEIENKYNVKSTYFFRLHSKGYNFFTLENIRKVKKISKMGHEIGLHYESDFFILNKKDILESIDAEVALMEHYLEEDIVSICPHEPTRTKSFFIEGLKKYNQAYDQDILKKTKYISDSSCRWRDGSFYENIQQNVQKLYILTHPYWWYEETPIENY